MEACEAIPPTSLSAQPDLIARVNALSAVQRSVLGLMGKGLSNRQAAAALGLAEVTVKGHLTRIMRALGVRNRTQVAVIAHRYGTQFAD